MTVLKKNGSSIRVVLDLILRPDTRWISCFQKARSGYPVVAGYWMSGPIFGFKMPGYRISGWITSFHEV